MVKQTAARHGLLATFMGKLRDDEGSGMHLHVSLQRDDGANAFDDPRGRTGCPTSPASSAPASWSTCPR